MTAAASTAARAQIGTELHSVKAPDGFGDRVRDYLRDHPNTSLRMGSPRT